MSNIFDGIEHVAISARSPEGLADWYVKTLEFEIYTTFDNGSNNPKTYMLRLGEHPPFLEIFAADRSRPGHEKLNTEPGLVHLAILVSDFDRAVQRLLKAGARPDGETRSGPLFSKIQFYRDPEGNLFHILWRPKALER
ncbi:MAG: VOC family protein [Planctomycetota bacterium]